MDRCCGTEGTGGTLQTPVSLDTGGRFIEVDIMAWRVTQSVRAGPNEHFVKRVGAEGWYYVEVKLTTQGAGGYRLRISKNPA